SRSWYTIFSRDWSSDVCSSDLRRMIILLTVAIAPSLALFSYFYLRDQFSSEPSRLLLNCFIYGAVLTFPIMFIQYVFQTEGVFKIGRASCRESVLYYLVSC